MLKSDESLEKLFQESIERQKKLKAKRKQQKLQQLKKIYHHQDILLKKSFREEKKKVMDNLQALIKQKPQNEGECEFQLSYRLYHGNETADEDLYQTRKELKQWEMENYPCINWTFWDKLVEETKQLINQSI